MIIVLIDLKRKEKDMLIREIQTYFYEEYGMEIGIIAAMNLLDFFDEQLGKVYYNKALDNARDWIKIRIEDMEIDYDLIYK